MIPIQNIQADLLKSIDKQRNQKMAIKGKLNFHGEMSVNLAFALIRALILISLL